MDTDELLLESCTVTYNYSQPRPGDSPTSTVVRRTGQLVVGDPKPSWLDPGQSVIQPWVEIKIPGFDSWARFYLGEFVTLAPTRNVQESRTFHTYRLADRIQRYSRAKTEDWVVAPIKANIALWVRAILTNGEWEGWKIHPNWDGFGETKIDIPVAKEELDYDLVFPANTSWLEIINTSLESVGWDPISINATGFVTTQKAKTLTASEWDYPTETPIVRSATVDPFVGEIPNVLIFKARRGPSLPEEGNGIFTVRNAGIGPFSIAGRGGEIVSEEVQVEASDQQQLVRLAASIAQVRFKGGGDVLRLKVGLNPLHDDKDRVTVTHEPAGVDAQEFWVSGWQVRMSEGIGDLATMDLTLEAAITIDDVFFYDAVNSTSYVTFQTPEPEGGPVSAPKFRSSSFVLDGVGLVKKPGKSM